MKFQSDELFARFNLETLTAVFFHSRPASPSPIEQEILTLSIPDIDKLKTYQGPEASCSRCGRREVCYPSLRNMYGTLCRQCLKKDVFANIKSRQ